MLQCKKYFYNFLLTNYLFIQFLFIFQRHPILRKECDSTIARVHGASHSHSCHGGCVESGVPRTRKGPEQLRSISGATIDCVANTDKQR